MHKTSQGFTHILIIVLVLLAGLGVIYIANFGLQSPTLFFSKANNQTVDTPFSSLWNNYVEITLTKTETLSSDQVSCIRLNKNHLANVNLGSDTLLTYKNQDLWVAPNQTFNLKSSNICFTPSETTSLNKLYVLIGNPNAPLPPSSGASDSSNNRNLKIKSQTLYQNTQLASFGDQGMTNPNVRVMLNALSSIGPRWQFDCTNINGSKLTPVADHLVVTSIGDQLYRAEQCRITEGNNSWFHWTATAVENLNAGESSSQYEIGLNETSLNPGGLPSGNFFGSWDSDANFEFAWSGITNKTYSAKLTTSKAHPWLSLYTPQADNYRQILDGHFLSGNSAIFKGSTTIKTLSVPGNPSLRFALPELSGCVGINGSPCDQASENQRVPTYFAFDANTLRIDSCTATDKSHCPPTHTDLTGRKIDKNSSDFPHDAYYYWCAPASLGIDPPCMQGIDQQIIQLQPSKEWAPFGFPTSPLKIGSNTNFQFDILAVTKRLHWAIPNAEFASIYIGPEIFVGGATVEYETSGWSLTQPTPTKVN